MVFKPKHKKPIAQEEEEEEEFEEDEEFEEESVKLPRVPSPPKKVPEILEEDKEGITVEDVLLDHSNRLSAIESSLFRLGKN